MHREEIARLENLSKNSLAWSLCALEWSRINESKEAARCLNHAKTIASSMWDWVDCARLSLELNQDEDAKASLRRAEPLATTTLEWIEISVSWMNGGATPEAVRTARNAEDSAVDLSEIRWCAKHWLALLDQSSAARCMELAESKALTTLDWCECADTWQALGEPVAANECLIKSEKAAACHSDWRWIVERRSESDESEALANGMEAAVSFAVSFSEWSWCAEQWLDCGAKDHARLAIRRAEESATQVAKNMGWDELQWATIQWKRLEDNEEIRRCLMTGCELLRHQVKFDQLQILSWLIESWIDLGEREIAKKYICKLKSMADSKWIWGNCAEFLNKISNVKAANEAAQQVLILTESEEEKDWTYYANLLRTLGKQSEAIASIERAEKRSEKSYQFRNCAEFWNDLEGNKERAVQCLEQAEAVVEDAGDWCLCARAWEEIGEGDRARRCLRHALVHSCDRSDWYGCAQTWLGLGNEEYAIDCLMWAEAFSRDDGDFGLQGEAWHEAGKTLGARRCFVKAEELCSMFFDWTSCSRRWIELGERGEARRCMKEAEALVEHDFELSDLQDAWIEIGEFDHAKRCLLGVETSAKQWSDWLFLADEWTKLGARNEIERVIVTAERSVESDEHGWNPWIKIAGAWLKLAAEDGVRRCLERAETLANETNAWLACAATRNRLNEPEVVDRWLEAAENAAESGKDLIECIKARRALKREAGISKCVRSAQIMGLTAEDIAWCFTMLKNIGEVDACRELLERAEAEDGNSEISRALVVCWLDFNYPIQAERILRKYLKEIDSVGEFMWASDTWIKLQNIEEAKSCLVSGEHLASGLSDWQLCAERWLKLKCKEEADDCMTEAEAHARSCREWSACAELWKNFDCEDDAHRCMENAEAVAEGALDWSTCSDGWQKIGEPDRAKRCLSLAEENADTSVEWTQIALSKGQLEDNLLDQSIYAEAAIYAEDALSIAMLPAGIFSDKDRLEAIKEAELMSVNAEDWLDLSLAWSVLANNEEHNRCIRTAEKLAQNARDWIRCAKKWNENGEIVEARRCLESATSSAENPESLVACVAGWSKLLGNEQEARLCLERAESIASNLMERFQCVAGWKILDDREVERCMKWATSTSVSSRDWYFCADNWNSLGNPREARRALEHAQNLAKDFYDYTLCAQYWHEIEAKTELEVCYKQILGWLDAAGIESLDAAKISYCLEKCQEFASESIYADVVKSSICYLDRVEKDTSSDQNLFAIYYIRKELGDLNGSHRIIKQYEHESQGTAAWLTCSSMWSEVGEPQNAQACIEQAESCAVFQDEWYDCSEAWSDTGENERAARCIRTAENHAIAIDALEKRLCDSGSEMHRVLELDTRIHLLDLYANTKFDINIEFEKRIHDHLEKIRKLIELEGDIFARARALIALGMSCLILDSSGEDKSFAETRERLAEASGMLNTFKADTCDEEQSDDLLEVHENLGMAWAKLVEVDWDAKEEARRHLEFALTLVSKEGQPRRWGELQFVLGYCLCSAKQEEEQARAFVCLENSLAIWDAEDHLANRRLVLRAMGDLFFRQQKWEEALWYYRKVIRINNEIFSAAHTLESRQQQLDERRDEYQSGAWCALKLGNVSLALFLAQDGQAHQLAEALAESGADLTGLSLRRRNMLGAARSGVKDLEEKFDRSVGQEAIEANNQLSAARQRLRRVIERIRAEYPEFMSPAIETAELLDLVPPGSVLIVPVVTSCGSAMIVLPSGRSEVNRGDVLWLKDFTQDVVKELLGHSEIGPKGSWIQAHLNRAASSDAWYWAIEETCKSLWPLLMGPLYNRLRQVGISEDQTVIVMPTGSLSLLPLHAAWRLDGGHRRFFIDEFPVSFLPNGLALRSSLARADTSDRYGRSILRLVNPNNDPMLSHAAEESFEIGSLFDHSQSEELTGAAATVQAVTGAMPAFSYVHFGCHAKHDWHDSLNSGLVLAEGERLTLSDILSQLDLPVTRLVSLSACDTGIVDLRTPSEMIGIPAGFLQAGAANVISTLWEVHDEQAKDVMISFYTEHVANGLPPAEALRKAQQLAHGLRASNAPDKVSGARLWAPMEGRATSADPGAWSWAAFQCWGV